MNTLARAAMAAEQVYAALITLQNDTLLLPNLGVTEIVSREGLSGADDTKPAWYAGQLTWQGQAVPVIRFEVMNGMTGDGSGRRSRIAIVNALGEHLPGRRFGIFCEGYPHLVTIQRESIRPAEPYPTDNPDAVLCRALVASRTLAIPNLERIEAAIAGLLKAPLTAPGK